MGRAGVESKGGAEQKAELRDAEEGRLRRNNRSVPLTAATTISRKIWIKTPRKSTEDPMKGGRAHAKT